MDIKMINKCDSCGKFRKYKELIGLSGEGNESWTECAYCCSDSDYESYLEKDLGKRDDYFKKVEGSL